jgi:hypothetical protein
MSLQDVSGLLLNITTLDESSIGMSPTRVSGVGRRLLYGAILDEKGLPFA